ncbi:tRNA-dependent cyclodipeptide synthase [Streptomyces sp. OspMP-M43]|uniref:tRNA-dependent cyclodipeptide synthase n=1 Tax=Streptomyces sp. OspMP-M43 TaxID=1839781 RepID=UPI00081B2EBC|nr:tRNA-dependent cyclodipeptide synthase [Streptomyces sp. OspMP-M43]SCE60717.1 tRNA-dependent cyclodipeptide synthase [Streptomyces sp. OspMP-M43]
MNRVHAVSPPIIGADGLPGAAVQGLSGLSGFRVEGLDLHNPRLAERYGTLVLGLSPFNSFYSTQTVADLCQSAANTFSDVHVVLPGAPESALRYISAGRAPRHAVQRSKRVIHNMRNVARRTLADCGVPDTDSRVHVMTRFTSHPRYQKYRARVEGAYRTQQPMREAVHAMTRTALATSLDSEPTPAQIESNTRYIFAEAPLLLDAAGMLARPSTLFVYHRRVPLYDVVAAGEVPGLTVGAGHTLSVLTDERNNHGSNDSR